MEPPRGQSGPPPPTRSHRVLGLLAAVGFSIAMWVFIALAVLGLILKIVGPRDAEEGLAAAGATVSQVFNLDSKETGAGSANSLTTDQGAIAGPIITLDSLASAPSKTPVARESGKPGEAPAKPAPATGPR